MKSPRIALVPRQGRILFAFALALNGVADDGPRLVEDRLYGDPAFRHAGAVTTLLALSDGKRLLSAAQDGTARLWEIPSVTIGVSP